MPMRSINFLFVFLNLFDDMESRYPNRFVPGTMRIIRQCADYQKDMLFRESPIPPDQFENLAKFDMWSEGTQTLNGSTVVEMRPEEDDPYYGLLPSITIKRTDRPTDTTEPRYANESPQNFPVILTKCVALTQQTIFRRRPREFPGLNFGPLQCEGKGTCFFHEVGQFAFFDDYVREKCSMCAGRVQDEDLDVDSNDDYDDDSEEDFSEDSNDNFNENSENSFGED
ncbi:MAG: hypothetical protein Q9221_000543 [Calogaya cf. arnoldii]